MKPVMNNMSVVVSRVLQIVVRYFNPIMRLVLGSRAHRMMSGQLMLLSFTGRRTGRSYTTPVSYVREGTNLLVPGGGAWSCDFTSVPKSDPDGSGEGRERHRARRVCDEVRVRWRLSPASVTPIAKESERGSTIIEERPSTQS